MTTETLPKETAKDARMISGLGVAAELLSSEVGLREQNSWMGISTSEKTYPDEMVIEFARWATQNTAGFTLVVSDWLQRFNWVAEGSRGWDDLYEGQHIRGLERDAERRAEHLSQTLGSEGINCNVILWIDMLRELEAKDEFLLNYGSQIIDYSVQHKTEAGIAIAAIAPMLVPKLIERGIERGNGESFVRQALSGYAQEEVLFSWVMADTETAPIKIGPNWERPYDEITADYSEKFGAVYLENDKI